MWDRQKAGVELERPEPEVLFVCGTDQNRDQFLCHFTKVFDFRIDDETLRQRLEVRTVQTPEVLGPVELARLVGVVAMETDGDDLLLVRSGQLVLVVPVAFCGWRRCRRAGSRSG